MIDEEILQAPRVKIDHDGAMSSIFSILSYPEIIVKVTPEKNTARDEHNLYEKMEYHSHSSLLIPFYTRRSVVESVFGLVPSWEFFMQRKTGSILRMPKQNSGIQLPHGIFTIESFRDLITSLATAATVLNTEYQYKHNHIAPRNIVFSTNGYGELSFDLIDFSHGTFAFEPKPHVGDKHGICRVISYALLGEVQYGSNIDDAIGKIYGKRIQEVMETYQWSNASYTHYQFVEDILSIL